MLYSIFIVSTVQNKLLACIFIFPVILCSDCRMSSLLEKLYIHDEVIPPYTLTDAMLRYKSRF